VDPVLERCPVPDEVEPEACPLALSADRRVGQPDDRHEVSSRQLGEHPRVDLVGCCCQGSERLGLRRVGELDVPTAELELIVDEAAPVIDSTTAVTSLPLQRDPPDESTQALSRGAAPRSSSRLSRSR
jgi:hypothetical protein